VQQAPTPSPPQEPAARSFVQRVLGVLAAIGAFLAKFGAVLLKLKVFTVAGSMVVSLAAYAWLWGWSFGLGFVLLLFVHECGHAITLRAMGVRASAPVFIPFLGAFIRMKESPRTAWQESVSGLAGPAFGAAAAGLCWWYAASTGSEFARGLAFAGFFLNLFNLIPVLPLDGGRAVAALSPVIWLVGLGALLVVEVLRPTPIVPIVLVLGGIEAWRRWRGRATAASRAYYALSPGQRGSVAAAYLSLVGFLALAQHAVYVPRHF